METIKNLIIGVLIAAVGGICSYYVGFSNYMKDFSSQVVNAELERFEELAEGTNKLVHIPRITPSTNPGVTPDRIRDRPVRAFQRGRR